jgi:hypothetical protein
MASWPVGYTAVTLVAAAKILERDEIVYGG